MTDLVRIGPYLLDVRNAQVRLVRGQKEEDIGLSAAEFQLLAFLVSRRGQLVTYDELSQLMWSGEFKKVDREIHIKRIHVHISHLKGKMIDGSESGDFITSVPKKGYRFEAEVSQNSQNDHQENGTHSWTKSHKLVLMGVLACIVVIVALLFWFARGQTLLPHAVNVQVPAQLTTWSGLTLFPAISPDGSRVAYSSDHNGSFEIYVRQLVPGAPEAQLTTDGEQNFQPTWSPDGERIAYHSKNRGGIWEISATGGKATQLVTFGSRPAWSPDGALIAFQSNALTDLGITARNALPPSLLWVIPAQGGEPKQITRSDNPSGGHGCPSWSPDGRRIAFEADQYDRSSVWSISLDGNDLMRISPERGYDPIYAPDGKSIFFILGGLLEVRLEAESGKPASSPTRIEGTMPAGPTELRYASISADGKKIAYSGLSQNSNLYSLPVPSNRKEAKAAALTDTASTRNSFSVYSPDGRKIAYDSGRIGAGVEIWIMNADGSDPIQVITHRTPSDRSSSVIDHLPSWFPNMDELAFLSIRDRRASIRAVMIGSGTERPLLDLDGDVGYFRLSPDGAQIAFTRTQDGVTNVWSIPVSGGAPRQLTFDKVMAGFPAWSPDGKWLSLEVKRGDDTHISFMSSSGGATRQLTFDRGQSWPHSWAPDADKIVFAGFREGYWNVWYVSRKSGAQKRLTDHQKLNAFVRYPSWSPLGNEIVYEYAETLGNIWVLFR